MSSSQQRHPQLDTTDIPIRELIAFAEDRKFDTRTLPADMQRVYKTLKKENGEEYALQVIFTIRTAIALHRAWHMTLLTSKILQQLKDRFRLRLSWNIGVFTLQFRISDGQAELYRKVPYDYDSEYQDIFMRIAIALMDNEITVHEALVFQWETSEGLHTAKSGLFLRDFPGRLILYPLVAATCAVIFFNGDWPDFAIAALCGFATGLTEMLLGMWGFGILTDTFVGTITGIIGGLFYRYGDQSVCLSSVFLGTLYWYFYGTAFVLGILEIIAGELETGVTRFIAVSVKTFVLCLGASFGLLVVGDATEAWADSAANNCNKMNLDEEWWRIPLYLLCSVAVLGQYRFPIVRYWRALITMLVGYEVQYQMFNFFANLYEVDNVDTAISNVLGCAAAVLSACAVSYYMNQVRYYYDARILRPDHPDTKSCIGQSIYGFLNCMVRLEDLVGLGRKSDALRLDMEQKLETARREASNARASNTQPPVIKLEPKEENLIIETIVGTQDMNIWSIMMPALYQLVPGSMIAKLWFGYIFPAQNQGFDVQVPGTDRTVTLYQYDAQENNVFGGLMIISTSLALGLVLGFALAEIIENLFALVCCVKPKSNLKNDYEKRQRAKDRRIGMYSAPITKEENPHSVAQEFKKAILTGLSTKAEADEIFNAIDIDQSDSIDEGEVSYYMLKAGLTKDQIRQLFASMDKDGNGEVSREEFRRAILDRSNKELLTPKQKGAVKESPVIRTDEKDNLGSDPSPTATKGSAGDSQEFDKA